MKKVLLSMLVMACAATASAAIYTYDFMSGGLAYKINEDGNNTVSVTHQQRSHYVGWSDELNMELCSPSYATLSGAVSIPSTVQYNNKMYRVTRIEQEAFWFCLNLTSISIPASVTTIEKNPFRYCINLETITVAEGNTKYDSRDNCNAVITKEAMNIDVLYINSSGSGDTYSEFWYTMPEEYAKDEVVVACKGTVIPSTVTSIGSDSFCGTRTLKSVVVPEGVTTIKKTAFVGSGIESLTLPSTLTKIGHAGFNGCDCLLDVYAYFDPANVTLDPNPNYPTLYDVWEGTLLLQPYNHPTNLHVYPEFVDWYVNQPEGSPWVSRQGDRFVVKGDLGQTPEATYIIGSWDGWAAEIALEQTNDGKWTITKAMDAGVEFKFKDENGNWYGGQDESGVNYFGITEEMVENGTAIALVDGANFRIPVAGEWTFTVDREAMTVVVSGEWPAPEPVQVYILGEVNDNYWSPAVGLKMDTEDNETFTAAEVNIDGRNDGYNYFSFTTKLAENADDWNGIAGYRFGAQSNDFEVTEELLGADLALQIGQNAFKLATGKYNFTLNYPGMTLKIEKVVPAGLKGDVNGDGDVNVIDITELIDVIMNDITDNPRADVNEDGHIDVMDITALIDIIMNM